MANPELGTKRTCLQCGVRFYDLERTTIVCPKCGHEHTAELFARNRRLRSTTADAAPKPKRVAPVVVAEPAEDDVDVEVEVDDEETDETFEDTADIGGDEDELAEVIDAVDDEEPDR
ncbi:MAG: TIGR02300 family protein [Alphaproteobacteria bacterium]